MEDCTIEATLINLKVNFENIRLSRRTVTWLAELSGELNSKMKAFKDIFDLVG